MRNAAILRGLGSALAIVALVGLAVGLGSADWFSLAWAGYVVVGWYLVLRRPANRMGRLLLIVGICFGGAIGLMPVAEATGSIWIEIVSSQISIVGFAAMAMVPIVFPTGRPSDRWGRWMATGLVAVALLTVASEVFGSDPKPSGRMSPLAVPSLREAAEFLQGEGFISVPLLLLGALAGLVARWRRSTGVERLQYRWFLSALGVVIGGLVTMVAVEKMPEWAVVLGLLSLNLLPASIGIAVLRYRLYEIDRIVSRTVTYGLVALLVAGVYATPVVTLPRLLGESNDLIVAGSTLAAAAAFDPVRRRVQRLVDRRFNRARYDADQLVDLFGERLRSETDLGAIERHLGRLIVEAIAPAGSALWIRERVA